MQKGRLKKLNVSEARRRRKFNLFKKWFKILFLLFLVFGLFFYIWNLVIKPGLVEKNFDNFLLSADCEDGAVLERHGKGFCLLTKHNLNIYENDGTCVKVFDFNLEKPAVHCCNSFALIYDKGGKFCKLLSSGKDLCSVVCDDNILLAKVSENGNFVVAMQNESFFTKFVVFNKKGQQIFKWNSAENLIIDFDFFKLGSGCFICTLGVSEDGFEKTVIYGFDFNKSREISKRVLNDSMSVSLKTLGSGFVLVCFNKLFLFDSNCSLVKELQFDDDWSGFYLSERGYFIFSFENRLIIYDKFANVFGKIELNEMVKKVKIEGKHVFVLVDGKLIICNLNLKILKFIELNKNVDDFFCSGKYCYCLSGGKLDRFKIF